MDILINTDNINYQIDIVQEEIDVVKRIISILERKQKEMNMLGLGLAPKGNVDELLAYFNELKQEFERKKETLYQIKINFKNWKMDIEMKYDVIQRLTDI